MLGGGVDDVYLLDLECLLARPKWRAASGEPRLRCNFFRWCFPSRELVTLCTTASIRNWSSNNAEESPGVMEPDFPCK